MTYCSKCSTAINDELKFCPNCGEAVENKPAVSPENNEIPKADTVSEALNKLKVTKDETECFEKADIENNKIMAVLAYIIFLVPLIAAKDSPFARFHTNQGIVLVIASVAASVIAVIPVFGWTIAPVIGIAVTVLAVIGILNSLNGRAKELPIIGKIRILK